MAGYSRLFLGLIVVLTILYALLFLYFKSGIKMRLEEEWVMEGRPGERDDWVDEKLAPKAARLRNWLLFFVYAVPLGLLPVLVFSSN